MTTMLQKKDDLGREVEEYRQLLEKQAITIKNLQSQLKTTESKVSSF